LKDPFVVIERVGVTDQLEVGEEELAATDTLQVDVH
jgi:hypothetical protein